MDSKLLRYALLIVTLFVGTIFVLMLGMNGFLTQKDTQTAVVQETVAEDLVEEDGRIEG